MAIPGTPSKIFISSVQRELASERRSVKSFWRDWLTDEVLAGYHLNDRQMGAIAYLKTHRSITNSTYQSEFTASKRTASRDLDEMMAKGIVEKVGTTGKGVHYRIGKGATKGPKGP